MRPKKRRGGQELLHLCGAARVQHIIQFRFIAEEALEVIDHQPLEIMGRHAPDGFITLCLLVRHIIAIALGFLVGMCRRHAPAMAIMEKADKKAWMFGAAALLLPVGVVRHMVLYRIP